MRRLYELLCQADDCTWADLLGDHRDLKTEIVDWSPDAADRLPEQCWQALDWARQGAGLSAGCEALPSLFASDPIRLHGNARRLFASGLAAAWLRNVGEPDHADHLSLWLSRAAGREEGQRVLAGAALAPIAWSAEPEARVAQLAGLLPPEHAAVLELWLRWWLGLPGPAVLRARRVPIAVYREDSGAGEVHDLPLALLEHGRPGLLEHPDIWKRRLRPEVLKPVKDAHAAESFDRPVVWSLAPRGSADLHVAMGGESHTAAARIGFHSLARDIEYDLGCLVTALVDGPNLGLVHGLKAKCDRAYALGLSRVVIAAPRNEGERARLESELPQAVIDGYRPRMEVVLRSTLAEAVEEATGLASGLRRYLDWAAGLPDIDPPPYLGGRRPTELYVEPEVHGDRVRLDSDEPGGRPQERAVLSADSDAAEAVLRYRQFGRERNRVRWSREWPKVRRAVIVGLPGEGKTMLAKMTARALAERGRRELAEQGTPAAAVTLPVFLRLADLARHGSLEAAVEASLPGPEALNLPPSFVQHLRQSLRAASAWLLLDGLDEVTEAQRPALKAILATLRDSACRVVVTSRPYGYRRGELPFSSVTEYELAPLRPKQRRDFLKEWFRHGKDEGRRDRVRELVEGHASLREVGGNALLLTLACAESGLRRLDPATTRRVHLYYWVVRDLVRGAWRDDPQDEGSLSVDRELRALRRLAWELFRPEPARVVFDNDRLFDALNAMGYDDARAEEQMRGWAGRGLLLPGVAPDTRRAGSFFLHRTFLEYLAADHVAHLPDPAAEVERYLWQPDGRGGEQWTPEAQEFVAFVAGGMARPTELLEWLLREAEARPDLLGVMWRLAGKCLAEADEKEVPQALATRVVDGCFGVWETLGRTGGAACSMGSRWGVARLIQTLLTDADNSIRARAAWALGDLGDSAAVAPLAEALRRDDRASVRSSAAGALGALGDSAAVAPLAEALRRDANAVVRSRAARALGALGDSAAVVPLAGAMRSDDDEVQDDAVLALEELGDAAAVAALVEALRGDASDNLRDGAALALAGVGDVAAMAALTEASRCDDDVVRHSAGFALERLGDDDDHLARLAAAAGSAPAVAPLAEALRRGDDSVRRSAAGALGALGDSAAVAPLAKALRRDNDSVVRWCAALALGRVGDAAAVAPLAKALRRDDNEIVRYTAARALGELRNAAALRPLAEALRRDNASVRCRAAKALGALGDAAAVAPLAVALRRDDEASVRQSAAKALGLLADAAAAAPLAEALHRDADSVVRDGAAEALTNLLDVHGRAKRTAT